MDAQQSAPAVIEERVKNPDGTSYIRQYNKGKFLGKGGFAKCYEFTSEDQSYACKVV